MKALILAGGEGSRIRPYSDLVPKCLLPVKGVPCARIIVDDLITQMPDVEIILCVNKRFEQHFRHEFRDLPGVHRISVTSEPMGTAGEISHAHHAGMLAENEPFLVIYGDDLTKIDYNDLVKCHNVNRDQYDSMATVVLTSNVPLEFGVVELDVKGIDHQVVTKFKEKPMYDKLVWTGKCVLDHAVLQFMEPWIGDIGDRGKMDLARDVFPKMLGRMHGYVTPSMWLDIGQLSHYMIANGE